jgi:hypothetical protein
MSIGEALSELNRLYSATDGSVSVFPVDRVFHNCSTKLCFTSAVRWFNVSVTPGTYDRLEVSAVGRQSVAGVRGVPL